MRVSGFGQLSGLLPLRKVTVMEGQGIELPCGSSSCSNQIMPVMQVSLRVFQLDMGMSKTKVSLNIPKTV